MNHVSHIWIMCHTYESCVTHMNHVSHIWIMCHTYECRFYLLLLSHMRMSHVLYMSHMRMSQVWYMNESCHKLEWVCHARTGVAVYLGPRLFDGYCATAQGSLDWFEVELSDLRAHRASLFRLIGVLSILVSWTLLRIWKSHVTHMNESCPYMNESCLIHEWVMAHVWIILLSCTNEVWTIHDTTDGQDRT